jgi:hypothetical protein
MVFSPTGALFFNKRASTPVAAFLFGERNMSEENCVPGIESKKKLLDFFVAKEHRNLVLHVPRLRELPLPIQHELITILVCDAGFSRELCADAGRFWIQNSRDGYLVVPFEKLLGEMDIKTVQRLQLILYLYKEERMGKGEPSRVDVCTCQKKPDCPKCQGQGMITTFLEMSEEEERLAEEKTSDESPQ